MYFLSFLYFLLNPDIFQKLTIHSKLRNDKLCLGPILHNPNPNPNLNPTTTKMTEMSKMKKGAFANLLLIHVLFKLE